MHSHFLSQGHGSLPAPQDFWGLLSQMKRHALNSCDIRKGSSSWGSISSQISLECMAWGPTSTVPEAGMGSAWKGAGTGHRQPQLHLCPNLMGTPCPEGVPAPGGILNWAPAWPQPEGHTQLRASAGLRAGQGHPWGQGTAGAVSQCQPSLEPQPCWGQSPWDPRVGQLSRAGWGGSSRTQWPWVGRGARQGIFPWGPGAVWGCSAGNGLEPGPAATPALPQAQPWCPRATIPQRSPEPPETADPSHRAVPIACDPAVLPPPRLP